MEKYTKKIADFVLDVTFDRLPHEVVSKAKDLFMDLLGAALPASMAPSTEIVMRLFKELGGREDCTIFGEETKTNVINAAFVNGTLGHALELDDTARDTWEHPGTAIVPTVLAIGEREHSTGKEVITAMAIGYDVMIRLGSMIDAETYYKRGFFLTSTCGTFGATCAAAKILNLDVDALVNAMGIAGSQASGLIECLIGGWTKQLGAGTAARNGLLSALLAREGFRGPESILEGKFGFFNAFFGSFDTARLVDGLGSEFKILKIIIKPYACCRYIHSSIDAVLGIVQEEDIRPEEVEEIEVTVPSRIYPIVAVPVEQKCQPKTFVEARFSLPYSVAVALAERKALIDEFSEEKIKDPSVHALARKVKVFPNEELDKIIPKHFPVIMKVRARGKEYLRSVRETLGDPEKPLSAEEMRNKFTNLASRRLPPEKVGKTIEIIKDLEKVRDINELTACLRP